MQLEMRVLWRVRVLKWEWRIRRSNRGGDRKTDTYRRGIHSGAMKQRCK